MEQTETLDQTSVEPSQDATVDRAIQRIGLPENVEVGRILVADDDETFLQSTAELLQQEGYQCDCAQNPAIAAQRIGENEYDLLIADITCYSEGQISRAENNRIHEIQAGQNYIAEQERPLYRRKNRPDPKSRRDGDFIHRCFS